MISTEHKEGFFLLAPVDSNGGCSTAVAVLGVNGAEGRSEFRWIGGERLSAFAEPAYITSCPELDGLLASPWSDRKLAVLRIPTPVTLGEGFDSAFDEIASALEGSRYPD